MVEIRSLFYEGKAKKLYHTDHPLSIIQEFKDDVTAFNKKKHEVIPGKGTLNARISEILFSHLEEAGIATHFLGALRGEPTHIVRKLMIIPVEVVVRNASAGSFAQRYNLDKDHVFSAPIVEFYLKEDDLNDPLITEDVLTQVMGIPEHDLRQAKTIALQTNRVLQGYFSALGLRLVDFKIELGVLDLNDELAAQFLESGGDFEDMNALMIADEISCDTMRLWDVATGKSLDKDVFRQGTGDLIQAYSEVLRRMETFL